MFDVLVQHLLQRAEVQAQGIWRQAQQGIGRGKTHGLLWVVEDRAEQQCALAGRHQADDAADRRLAHQGRRVGQVFIRQLQGLRAGVVR